MPQKPELRIGLIGSGFMGMAHSFGLATAEKVFDLPYRISLQTLADITPEAAATAADALGYAQSTGEWRDLVADPTIDVVHITAPNALHKEMSLAAISKHLTILTRAGLISQEKRGRVKWCKLEPDALRGASVWMQGFGQFEPVNLDAFESFLAREHLLASGQQAAADQDQQQNE